MVVHRAIAYFFREASLNLARSWKISLVAVSTIAMSLFIGGALLLLTTNLRRLVADWRSEAKVVVASHHLAKVARELPRHAPRCQRWLMVDGDAPGFEAYPSALARHPAQPLAQEPAGTFMLYSSGTTGRPKGILRALPNKSISEDPGPVAMLERMLWGFDQNTVYLSPAPLYHSAPLRFSTSISSLCGEKTMEPTRLLVASRATSLTSGNW